MARKPHICMLVTNDLTRDYRVHRTATTLTENGFDVTVICTSSENTLKKETIGEYNVVRVWSPTYVRTSVKVISLFFASLRYLTRKFLSPFHYISRRKHQLDRKMKYLERKILNEISGVSYLLCHIRSTKSQSENFVRTGLSKGPDIVCSNDLDTLHEGVEICRKTGALLVYDSHELWVEIDPAWSTLIKSYVRRREAKLIREADAVMTVNNSLANELSRRYGITKPFVVMNCQPSTMVLRPLVNEIEEKRDYSILYHGYFSQNRGLDRLVLAAKYLKTGRIVMRGYGPFESTLKEKVEKNQLQDKVIFEPPVKLDDVIRLANKADIGVVQFTPTCLNNYYVSPNKLFEYMAAGLAICASDLPEMRKVLRKYRCGLLFNPYDPKDIAEKINSLTGDLKLLTEMKNNSINAVLNECNWENESKKLVDAYKRLAEKRGFTFND